MVLVSLVRALVSLILAVIPVAMAVARPLAMPMFTDRFMHRNQWSDMPGLIVCAIMSLRWLKTLSTFKGHSTEG